MLQERSYSASHKKHTHIKQSISLSHLRTFTSFSLTPSASLSHIHSLARWFAVPVSAGQSEGPIGDNVAIAAVTASRAYATPTTYEVRWDEVRWVILYERSWTDDAGVRIVRRWALLSPRLTVYKVQLHVSDLLSDVARNLASVAKACYWNRRSWYFLAHEVVLQAIS